MKQTKQTCDENNKNPAKTKLTVTKTYGKQWKESKVANTPTKLNKTITTHHKKHMTLKLSEIQELKTTKQNKTKTNS